MGLNKEVARCGVALAGKLAPNYVVLGPEIYFHNIRFLDFLNYRRFLVE